MQNEDPSRDSFLLRVSALRAFCLFMWLTFHMGEVSNPQKKEKVGLKESGWGQMLDWLSTTFGFVAALNGWSDTSS